MPVNLQSVFATKETCSLLGRDRARLDMFLEGNENKTGA
jgi:hypothetical protein